MGLVTRVRQPQKSYPANFSNGIVQEFIRDSSNDKIPYPIKKALNVSCYVSMRKVMLVEKFLGFLKIVE